MPPSTFPTDGAPRSGPPTLDLTTTDDMPSPDFLRVEVVDVGPQPLTCGRRLRHPFIIAAVLQPLRPSGLEEPL